MADSTLGRQVDINALVGANTGKLVSQGKLILKSGKYYMPAPRKKTGNAFWDNFGDTPPTKPLPKGGTYKWKTGGGAEPPQMGGPGGSGSGPGGDPYAAMMGSGASRPSGGGGGGSLAGLSGLAGGAGGGGPQIGMGAGGGNPVDVAAPEEPMGPMDLGGPGQAGGQMLSGPTTGRRGLGQRVPPSLAALLKPKVY
jgi:hypothetical protein